MDDYRVKMVATRHVWVEAESEEEALEKAEDTDWMWTEASLDLELD